MMPVQGIQMEFADVHHPFWFSVPILLALFYPFFARLFARTRDLCAVAAIPLTANTCFAFLGLFQVTGALPVVGVAPHALAAGLAEALAPIVAGAASATATALYLAVFVGGRRPVSRVFLLAVSLTVSSLAGYVVVATLLHSERVAYSVKLGDAVVLLTVTAVLGLILNAVAATLPPSRIAPTASRRRLFSFAGVALVIALVSFCLMQRLQIFAIGG